MQNKANFRTIIIVVSSFLTSEYEILSRLSGQKTKPIQTQFKANKAKNKPNSNPNKANYRKTKMNAFVWIRSFTMKYCDFLADFTTLKGANAETALKG